MVGDVRPPFNAAEPPGTPWARVSTRKAPISGSWAATTLVAVGADSSLRQIVESGVDVKRLRQMIFSGGQRQGAMLKCGNGGTPPLAEIQLS